MKARRRLLALLVALGLASAGCTQIRSIERDALLVGVGVDAGTQPGSVGVLAQWYYHGTPSQAGGSSGGGPSPIESMVGRGATVAAAIDQIQAQSDQRVSYLALQLIVVGDQLARLGMNGPVDNFWRSEEVFSHAQVAIARGSAAALLQSPVPGGAAFSLYQRLTHSGATATGSIPIPLWEFLARANNRYMAAWAPLFATSPDGYVADGAAVFLGDRLVGELGVAETDALSWLVKAGGYEDLTVPPPAGSAGVPAVLRVRSRQLRITVAGAQRADVSLALRCEVREGWGIQVAGRDPRPLEAAASSQATRDVETLIARLQAFDSDVLGLGERLREQNPAAAATWPQGFAAMRIGVHVAVHVGAAGRSG